MGATGDENETIGLASHRYAAGADERRTRHSRGRIWLRRAARTIGIVAAAFWLIAVIGALIAGDEHAEEGNAEGIGVGLLVVANVAAVVLAVWRDRFGGRMLVVTGIAFCVFALLTAGHNHPLAMVVSGGPFLVSGLLFVVSGIGNRKTEIAETAESGRQTD